MTGIADFYLYVKRPYSKDRRKRFLSHFLPTPKDTLSRFVVLSWKRTGSNLLCGILHNHPEIIMHNELFNPIDIFTYHPKVFQSDLRWTVLTRDLFPEDFLDFVWTGSYPPALDEDGIDSKERHFIKPKGKVVGFKSFPDHWTDVRNEGVWQEVILEDFRVKKVILKRDDELAVYISMLRADQTGRYMTHRYPEGMRFHIEPARFQGFVDNYRDTFQRKYKSPVCGRDTFIITYEQLVDESFEGEILSLLWKFLGVDPSKELRTLQETTKQADPNEDLSHVISNYEELEFCFRHSNVLHFKKRQDALLEQVATQDNALSFEQLPSQTPTTDLEDSAWSLLLPICSRGKSDQVASKHSVNAEESTAKQFDTNRFLDLTLASQHKAAVKMSDEICWSMLEDFATTLRETSSPNQLKSTEAIVGIDVDDPVYSNEDARKRIVAMMPCKVEFVTIQPDMYGKVCKIWNFLARHASREFVVLLGDDIRLLDDGWQAQVVQKFHDISDATKLPFGCACVALNDLSFPGFPTFPVLHRWHIQSFGSLLPKQFVNQGGDPYLFELYARFNASDFVPSARLENTIGGDGDARYRKYRINWRGQILNMNLRHLRKELQVNHMKGAVIDVVVPSYRTDNDEILKRICRLRATVPAYIKFWIVVDNPLESHVAGVKKLQSRLNDEQLRKSSNYYINVIHYSENRGASYARNTGYNYSTADYIIFLDDDVVPDQHILDAYIGAIKRYPDAKVFVGNTDLPEACNRWTEMLCACNVGYFYSIAQKMVRPSWGVTANLMVRGSRFNSTIQFKSIYPKTGGGEDIDFVYQYKNFYASQGLRVTVAVPEAKVAHPWWKNGSVCYGQIIGWARGDSMCITEWPEKTFLAFPNWIEHVSFFVLPLSIYMRRPVVGIATSLAIITTEFLIKGSHYFEDACRIVRHRESGGWLRKAAVAIGAGSILSAQEATRTWCMIQRGSVYSFCRRVDWFDGQKPTIRLDIQLNSIFRFALNSCITMLGFRQCLKN
ncbi:MAG: hypothetical protein SGILL_000734 [Bacillariaceae sp.]